MSIDTAIDLPGVGNHLVRVVFFSRRVMVKKRL
jgi:hypothetical protein